MGKNYAFVMLTFLLYVTDYALSAMCPWPPTNLQGRQPLNRTTYDYNLLENINSFMTLASYKPSHCEPRQKVAIIVPYRNREPQLKVFLLNVLPKLYRQNLEYTVLVIEQAGTDLFNKGALINIGFLEAKKRGTYDCIIFHDVDILPEDDRNFYLCGKNPRNLAVLVEQFNYSLFHSEYLGGIVTFTMKQFVDINGFSNIYKGWGIEDDDAYRRIRSAGYKLDRPDYNVSYCGSIHHNKANRENDRCSFFLDYGRYWKFDGLSSIEYKVTVKNPNKLCYWFSVEFDTDGMRQNLTKLVQKINKNTLPARYPSYKDGFCKWFLNQKLFLRRNERKQCKKKLQDDRCQRYE